MRIQNKYVPRPIRFLELHQHNGWQIKIYSISINSEFVEKEIVDLAKTHLTKWFQNAGNYYLDTYKIATLILHKGKEGYFALINWWIDENMVQNHVYLLKNEKLASFTSYSNKGIMACIWELEVFWFERNAWIKHVLLNAPSPDYNSYLEEHLNKD